MEIKELLEKIKGIQTIESVKSILNIRREKAIYYVYRLRKKGYIKTKRLNNNRRVYYINFENKLKGTSYYDIINENSPIKIAKPNTYSIYGRKVSFEETLIFAVKTKSLRTILASLALFKKINDWNNLYRLAKENNIEREIGALYDLAREFMRTRKMKKRFRNNALPKKGEHFKYIINGLSSEDFKDIEREWKIYLPFNKADLEVYK